MMNIEDLKENKKCNYCNDEDEDTILLWDNELDKPNMIHFNCLCINCYSKLSPNE